jgi:hypothetical protein
MATAHTKRSETLTEIRDNVAAERAAATRRFLLAARWADDNLDPEQPQPTGECPHGCEAADRSHEEGDFNGGCLHGCAGDPDGFSDPFIPVVSSVSTRPAKKSDT